jgi:hypothetical protein
VDLKLSRKTVIIFRKRGKVAANNNISFKEEKLDTVNISKYLGLTVQSGRTSFTEHIKERTIIASKQCRT